MWARLLLLLLPPAALACSCNEPTVCSLLRWPVLFTGEVIAGGVTSIADDPWYAEHVKSVRFRVVEAFRGVKAGEVVDMNLRLEPGMCAPIPYFPGRRYLVPSAFGADGKLSDGRCFSGEDAVQSADRIGFLRDYFSGKVPLSIHGRVATFHHELPSSFWIGFGRAKMLSGARVIAQRGGRTFETISDSDGNYFLELPAPGRYLVRAILGSNRPQPDQAVEVKAGSCAVADIGMTTSNTISGRVADREGKPVHGAEVHLMDADPGRTEFRLKTTTLSDGSFRFGGGWEVVPNGRFRVAVNPEKPTGTHRYEPSFHPHVVEVRGSAAHVANIGIVAGRLIGFRKIRVKVTQTGGKPMDHAVVHATFASNPKWHYERVPMKKGVAEFHAPSEAPVRIWISDEHGRDLGAKYEAEFPADWRLLEHEFVVRP